MASILPGFEYDIFISYRHKDNKGDHWVTDFVTALKTELESTFKEDISIYFDTNPHDGLLETHNVDKSLEDKLKCLIFIPIISQTYCDPKSFAWQHEFVAFNKLAKGDVFGRDIKLSNGNVASRILPIKIHDLDEEDRATIEHEIGGVLRAIEFIFRSAGVHRPLRAVEDHPQDNLNKTFYRDQVNKVANAIKELIQIMKIPQVVRRPAHEHKSPEISGLNKKMAAIAALILIAVSIGAYFVAPRWLSLKAEDEFVNKSIAVLPFTNLSSDPEQEYFSDGITEQIITNLAHINSLKVIARTSVMKFKKTDKSIAEIGKELNVTHVLEGSIRKSEDRVRVTAQLIAVSDEAHVWAQDYDRKWSDIFTVQDEVSAAIAGQLERKLTQREYETLKADRPANVEAYKHYLKGYYGHLDLYYVKRLKEDFIRSEKEFKTAIDLDPNYGRSYSGLADLYDTYSNFGAQSGDEKLRFQKLRDSCSDIAIKLAPNDPYVLAVKAFSFSNKADKTDADIDSTFKYRRKAYAISPNDAGICDALSVDYVGQGLYIQSLHLRERAISLDPTFGTYYGNLGAIYFLQGEFDKAEAALKKATLLEPEDVGSLIATIQLKLFTNHVEEAALAMKKLKAVNPQSSPVWLENLLTARLLLDKGEKSKALSTSGTWFILLALSMKKEALDELEKGNNRYLNLKNSPIYDPLRADPRFQKMLENAKVVYEERLKKYAN